MMGFGMGTGWLLGLVIIGVLAWAIIQMGRSSIHPQRKASSAERRAVEILKRRFARGEIDRQEFDSRRHHLEDTP